MSAEPSIDPQTGALKLSPEAWQALIGQLGESVDQQPTASDERLLAQLGEQRILSDDAVDARIGPALHTVAHADTRLELTLRDRRIEGWLGGRGATLVVPVTDEAVEVTWAPIDLLPEAIARLVGLAPGSAGDGTLTLAPASLAQALSGHSQAKGGDGGPLGTVQRHWLLELHSSADEASPERLEVLETERGRFRVESADGAVELSGVSASTVWRSLTAIVAAVVVR